MRLIVRFGAVDKRERYELWRNSPDRSVLAALSGFAAPVPLSDIAQVLGCDDHGEVCDQVLPALLRLKAIGLIHLYAPAPDPERRRGPNACVRWGLVEVVVRG